MAVFRYNKAEFLDLSFSLMSLIFCCSKHTGSAYFFLYLKKQTSLVQVQMLLLIKYQNFPSWNIALEVSPLDWKKGSVKYLKGTQEWLLVRKEAESIRVLKIQIQISRKNISDKTDYYLNYRIRVVEWTLLFNSICTFTDEETEAIRKGRA